jgi:hypothetical protein
MIEAAIKCLAATEYAQQADHRAAALGENDERLRCSPCGGGPMRVIVRRLSEEEFRLASSSRCTNAHLCCVPHHDKKCCYSFEGEKFAFH